MGDGEVRDGEREKGDGGRVGNTQDVYVLRVELLSSLLYVRLSTNSDDTTGHQKTRTTPISTVEGLPSNAVSRPWSGIETALECVAVYNDDTPPSFSRSQIAGCLSESCFCKRVPCVGIWNIFKGRHRRYSEETSTEARHRYIAVYLNTVCICIFN